MKRIILVFLVIFSLVIALPSCEFETETPNSEFEWLNTLCNRNYSSYTIDVTVESENGETINEHYDVEIIDGVKYVTYKVERLSGFEINGGEIALPGEYIKVTEGSFTTEDDQYALPTFNFSYKCLKSDVVVANTLKAKITSLSQFMGVDMDVTDAKVLATYSSSSVESVAISYVTESGNTVTVTYTY